MRRAAWSIIEFIAQYLQLRPRRRACRRSSTPSTARVLDKRAAAGPARRRGRRRAAAGGAALSGPDADPAALPRRAVRSEGKAGAGLLAPACARRRTARLRRRWRRTLAETQEECARASCGFLATKRRRANGSRAAAIRALASARRRARSSALERQAHPARSCRARRGADAHRAAMQLGQRPGDGEAEARALVVLGELVLHLLERPCRACASASAGMPMPVSSIEMIDARRPIARARTVMRPPSGRELHRVREQIDAAICLSARRSALQRNCRLDLGLDRELLVGRARTRRCASSSVEHACRARAASSSSCMRPASIFDMSRMSLMTSSR